MEWARIANPRYRVVGGTITKTTGGDHNIYSDGNIVYNAGKAITETSDKGIIYGEPKDAPPAPLLKKYFVEGWWSSDEAGDKRIKEALVGDHVYFHIKTKDIPNGEVVQMKLYDDDNNEKNEPKEKSKDHDDFKKMINTQTNQEVASGTVKDNKVVKSIMLENFESFIKDETDKQIELYYRCSYKTEHVEFPRTPSDYLKVKEKEPLIVFVNGYWNKGIIKNLTGDQYGEAYWGTRLKNSAKKYFKTQKSLFINGAGEKGDSGSKRFKMGIVFAQERFNNNKSNFYKEIFEHKRKIMIVSHSMGGAFAEGMIKVMKEKKVNIYKVVHFSPADVSGFSASLPDRTFQIDIEGDIVLLYKNFDDANHINNITSAGLVKAPNGYDKMTGHADTKWEDYAWNWFVDLENINLRYSKILEYTEVTPSFGGNEVSSYPLKRELYLANGNEHSTVFLRLYKNNILFKFYNSNNEYLKW